MLIAPELERTLRSLRLSGMAASLPARLAQAADGGVAPLEFLELLLQDELTRRKDRLFDRRLKLARLNPLKRLDDFDWSFNPKLPRKLVCEFATAQFVANKENIIAIGPPGTGKSHLMNAIALCAIHAGFAPLSFQIHDLIAAIAEASATGEREAFFNRLLKTDLLILDDLGFKRLRHEDAEELLEIIMRRYERASTIMISNRPIEDWPKTLGDAATTSALLDRLMHHAHFLSFQGKSYRMEQSALAKIRKDS
jgi:DNA replication protein DnaC